MAGARATPEDVAKLRESATVTDDPGDDLRFADYCRSNARFHLNVVRAARNAMLENIVMSALDMYQRPAYLRIGRQMDPTNPSAKHRAIAEAIAVRDADQARDIMLKHVLGGGERILEALKSAGYT